ncbi:MAG: methylenetetrahydrofolate reductase [Actinomycetota bacterium]
MVHIADLLAAGPTCSFECFPPRTEAAEAQLAATLHDLESLRPSFVSVTYGAGGSTREKTHELVVRIERETALTAMAHLTCAAHTRAELEGIVGRSGREEVGDVNHGRPG